MHLIRILRYKDNVQKSIVFLHISNKQLEIEILIVSFIIASKYEVVKDKCNKICDGFGRLKTTQHWWEK